MNRLNFFKNRLKADKIDVSSYLSRLKVKWETPSIQYLKVLQKAHLHHIPFENLDIHYKNKIVLNYELFFQKIIINKRGGFCYELNGLFYSLLYHLGFDCSIISARVFNNRTGKWGNKFDHLAIIVVLDSKSWLVDVGFGNGPVSPLDLKVGEIQIDYTRYWKIDTDPDKNLILKESSDASHFKTLYMFKKQTKQLIEFMRMCEFHQTSTKSHFTQKKIITKLTSKGRVTLTDSKLKISSLGHSREWPIMNEDEFLSKLKYHFGISFRELMKLND